MAFADFRSVIYALNCDTPKIYVEVLTLSTVLQTVTLFGNRVIVDVIS